MLRNFRLEGLQRVCVRSMCGALLFIGFKSLKGVEYAMKFSTCTGLILLESLIVLRVRMR